MIYNSAVRMVLHEVPRSILNLRYCQIGTYAGYMQGISCLDKVF